MKKSALLYFILCIMFSACNANKVNKTYPADANNGSSSESGGGGGCCN